MTDLVRYHKSFAMITLAFVNLLSRLENTEKDEIVSLAGIKMMARLSVEVFKVGDPTCIGNARIIANILQKSEVKTRKAIAELKKRGLAVVYYDKNKGQKRLILNPEYVLMGADGSQTLAIQRKLWEEHYTPGNP